jgi:hypothetical protein
MFRTACLLLTACLPAFAQEPPPRPDPLGGGDASQRELVELFGKVERKLRRIDTVLFDAGAGKAPKDAVKDAGIADLLKNAAQSGQEVKRDIDRILEIARQMQASSSTGGGSGDQTKPEGESPLDKQGGGQKDREQTPKEPGPEDGGKQPGHQQKIPTSNKPDDPRQPSENVAGQDPPKLATERVRSPDSKDRWGDLPVRVREVFRVEGGGDLPPQYRDWIDGYYRRLQRISGRN